MGSVSTFKKSIKSSSSQIDHYREKLEKKLGKMESRFTHLSKKALNQIKTQYEKNTLKGKISSPSPDIEALSKKIENALPG